MADAVEFIGNAAYRIIDALDYIAFGQIPNDFIESIKSGAESMGANIRSIGVGGETVGANAAASTVAATTTPTKQGGFAKPENMMARGESTIVNNNIYIQDDAVVAKADRAASLDKNQIFTKP